MKRVLWISLFTLISSLFTFTSCQRHYNDAPGTKDTITQEQIMDANKALVHGESERINDFIKHHRFNMQSTGAGLRYEIYEKGTGRLPSSSSAVVIAFKVYLLNDSLCYSVEESKPMNTRLGSGEQVRGLEEGLLMMPEGSRARFLIPDHLAYGLSGDGNKIPPGAALYYDVHLISVK